jgi:glycerophosphoryl diester phosphodiesterase
VTRLLAIFIACWTLVANGQQIESLKRELRNPTSSTILVAAHRATHNFYPENSLKAIQESIRIGVDIIEIDVKVSTDGVPFLMHDERLDRTTTGKGNAESFTWAELQGLFIVNKGKRTSLKIPSLEEALTLARHKILVDLDLKTNKIEAVIDIVKKTETEDIVLFFDSDYEILSKVQKANKDFMVMPRAYSSEQTDSLIAAFDPPVVHIDFSFYNKEVTQMIQSSLARVWINALGDFDLEIARGKEKHALKKLLEYGANIIQTDEPLLLLKALREQELHQ